MKKNVNQLYIVKWKRGERDEGEWLIGAHTQNIGPLPFNWNNTTQNEKKARKALTDEGKGAQARIDDG